jgi:hypothetical protein
VCLIRLVCVCVCVRACVRVCVVLQSIDLHGHLIAFQTVSSIVVCFLRLHTYSTLYFFLYVQSTPRLLRYPSPNFNFTFYRFFFSRKLPSLFSHFSQREIIYSKLLQGCYVKLNVMEGERGEED